MRSTLRDSDTDSHADWVEYRMVIFAILAAIATLLVRG
jgi:hypothetical protein